MFLRFTGTDADTANATILGGKKNDTLKSHAHAGARLYPVSDVESSAAANRYAANTPDITGATGSAETAPKHTYFCPFINL
jgi:hypothetical protein